MFTKARTKKMSQKSDKIKTMNNLLCYQNEFARIRVKSGNFGHQVNSDSDLV